MSELYPMLIEPRFDERIWGGHYLAEQMGKDVSAEREIGESWEVYDENRVLNGAYAGRRIADLRAELGADLMGHVECDRPYPLLSKFIDARDVLSVQVHPDDAEAERLEAQPNGKTECWYVLHAEPGAELIYGFTRTTSRHEYERLLERGELSSILRRIPVQPGDVVYVPARTLHAINAGIVVFELQQSSDVTYRIYDWDRKDAQGKPRELHLAKALQVLDFRGTTRGVVQPLADPDGRRSTLIAAPYFTLDLMEIRSPMQISTGTSPIAITTLDQPVTVRVRGTAVDVSKFSSVMVPAEAESFDLQPADESGSRVRALVAAVPTSTDATRQSLIERGFAWDDVDEFLLQFAPA